MFVHARNATVKTATALRDMAASNGELPLFAAEQTAQLGLAEKQVSFFCFQTDSILFLLLWVLTLNVHMSENH